MTIKEVALLTKDLGATRHFYTHILQLPVLAESQATVSFGIGSSVLTFYYSDAPSEPFYHVAFSIPHSQVAAALTWVECRIPILPGPQGQAVFDFPGWLAQAFYFHDNNGNILECIGRQPLGDAATDLAAPFLLGINEIGVPATNLLSEAEMLSATYGVPFFFRGPKLADFNVLGDDTGLFIMPATGRGWLPTSRLAERHWLRVQFEQNGQLHTLERD
jgi:catechol 2,3-dioxygenase-like lactoylglutathione lyase family enzyme